ncbi:unnamed protein product [Phytophthora fragariaefolia]|uniref:Unnamed protein product n=1 Tax=Phytophthora fragariaefolia TaxID=1490495 RepID=A0A9W6YAU2_9STRA|nr:unnamed protein product [Phytophthora fragariaefolia]
MSILYEPSIPTSCFCQPEVSEDQVSLTEILAMLDGVLDSDLSAEALLHEKVSVSEVKSTSLRTLQPFARSKDGINETKSKRGRRLTTERPRLRNKGKIDILRREVMTLEEELEALWHTRANPKGCRINSLWKTIALEQSQEREKAETQNKALKSLLSAQCTLTTSLSGVLSEWTNLPTPDLSFSI